MIVQSNFVLTTLPSPPRQRPVTDIINSVRGQNRVALLLIYGAALRVLDCLRIKVCDLYFKRREIVIRASNRHKTRIIKMPGGLVDELKALSCGRSRDDFIFASNRKNGRHVTPESVQMQLRFARERLGVTQEITPETLAILSVRMMHANGASCHDIARQSGASMTQIMKRIGHGKNGKLQIKGPLD